MFVFLMWFSGLFALLAPANPDIKQIAGRLESRYRSARTLQATFLERYSENGQLLRSEAGTAYFLRPGKMRWEYESPEKNLFLVDGKTAWFYVPADHTVTRAPAKDSSDWRTPLALLASEMKLSRACARIDLAVNEIADTPGDVVLACHLRGAASAAQKGIPDGPQDAGAEAVYLEVVPATGDLARVLIREQGEISIDFRFAGWRFDLPLPDSFFRFTVPRGVAIVNGENADQAKP